MDSIKDRKKEVEMTEMKLTVGQVVGGVNALTSLTDKELPVLTAWKLAKASRILTDEFESYEEVRKGLVKKFGKKDEYGNYQVKPESLEKFQDEMNKILEQEVTVDVPLISLEMLGEGNFKPRDLALAWFLFEEEHEDESKGSSKEGQPG